MRDSGIIAMQEGFVDFGRYPDAALHDIAIKRSYTGDRVILIGKLRRLLLLGESKFVEHVLTDLHDAAVKHGAEDVVVLTPPRR
jgi:hypothetical protein